MDELRSPGLHGADNLSGPKNSLFNAIEDALGLPDLSLVFIDTHDGSLHIAGKQIREIARSAEYASYKQPLHDGGRERD